MKTKERNLIELLPDPDNVGQSEYRALYDLLSDVLENVTPDDHAGVALGVLTEAKGWADTLIKQIKTYQKNREDARMNQYRIRERAVYQIDAPTAQDAMDQFLSMGSVERDRCFVEVTERELLDDQGRPQDVIEKEG